MKFGEKYELLESLTTGAIETFAANDKVRGERVLVHIVECTPQAADQSTSEWVLESFRRMAPEPAGPILETGKYSGTQYAYLVTRPADEAAVRGWVRRYELQSQETKETSVHRIQAAGIPPAPTPANAPPAATPSESRPATGQMTQLLRDYDSIMKSRSGSGAAPPAQQPAARPINLTEESGLHKATPWDPPNFKPATPQKERSAESFSSPVRPVMPEIPPAPEKEGPKPGEFTSFFQGPFRGDTPAEVTGFASEPIEPPRKNVGEFTAMFGQATPQQQSSTPPGNKVSATGFTGLFRDMEKRQPLNPSAPVAGGVLPGPIEPYPAPSVPQDASRSPQAPIFVNPPTPVFSEPPAAPVAPIAPTPAVRPIPSSPSSLPGDGATGAFSRPSSEPVPAPVALPSGPSPYTQIISRSKAEVAGQEAAAAHPPANPAAAGGFPPLPKIPPPAPMLSPPPRMPKMTGPKPPAAPKVPKLDAAPPPPVSYWPLIITLTVLFFLAALLVLYFVLKH